MSPPAKKTKRTPSPKKTTPKSTPQRRGGPRGVAAAAVAAAEPEPSGPAAGAVVDNPTGAPPAEEQATGVTPEVLIALVQGSARTPFKTSVGEQHRLAVSLDDLPHLTASQGPLLLMLNPTYPAKPYFDNENSMYSYFVDVGRQLPNGRMAKLFVLIPGDIESVAMIRIGDSFPTMRLRVHEAATGSLEAFGQACVNALMQPQCRARLRDANRGSKNIKRRSTKCDFTDLSGEFTDLVWFNRLDHASLFIYSVNPDTGKVLRKPEWFASRPIDAAGYDGLPVKVLCEVTLRVTAPLVEHPQPKATVKLMLKPHQFVLQGQDPRRDSDTSVFSMGLEMDDDAPATDDDEPSGGGAATPPPPLFLSPVAARCLVVRHAVRWCLCWRHLYRR
jgi:hypothetical protein